MLTRRHFIAQATLGATALALGPAFAQTPTYNTLECNMASTTLSIQEDTVVDLTIALGNGTAVASYSSRDTPRTIRINAQRYIIGHGFTGIMKVLVKGTRRSGGTSFSLEVPDILTQPATPRTVTLADPVTQKTILSFKLGTGVTTQSNPTMGPTSPIVTKVTINLTNVFQHLPNL